MDLRFQRREPIKPQIRCLYDRPTFSNKKVVNMNPTYNNHKSMCYSLARFEIKWLTVYTCTKIIHRISKGRSHHPLSTPVYGGVLRGVTNPSPEKTPSHDTTTVPRDDAHPPHQNVCDFNFISPPAKLLPVLGSGVNLPISN